MSSTHDSFPVKFLPFSSTVDSPFWFQYCHLKLETIQLSEEALPITASYAPGEPRLQCQESSLRSSSNNAVTNDRVAYSGKLMGVNTLEAFQTINKNQLLRDAFVESFETASKPPLTSFVVLTFADLKQHKVLYWFGIPALLCQTPLEATVLTPTDHEYEWWPSLSRRVHALRQSCFHTHYAGLPPFFVFDKSSDETSIQVLDGAFLQNDSEEPVEKSNLVFGFMDPAPPTTTATDPTEPSPMGWPLRHLIAYLSIHLQLGGKQVTIVSFKPTTPFRRITADNANEALPVAMEQNHAAHSTILRVTVPNADKYRYENKNETTTDSSPYKVVGWELNARQKPGPRWVNLRPLLDSNHLAIQAADLNLKLMKWRMLPSLNVDKLQQTKVLLLGAGTLGCSVARTLLGWGIRHFTILDYGNVSYSNPVRQNLFSLEDCHFNNGSGKPKAQAAVDALKTIAADVHAEAVRLSIPMPGHEESREAIEKAVSQLDQLIQDCDVVYLLTDTRESRWLPTIMAAAHDKIMINAALGLDSWLVMRHGGGNVQQDGNSRPRLGCYFCNDVVAPENSTKNRTLDQQCTVTRPGLAPIASSMAVELMVAMLHHPHQQRAPAPKQQSNSFSPTVSSSDDQDDGRDSALGVMPHQIRGSLVSYTMMTPTVPAFSCCTGCAATTIEAYHQDKFDLVYQVCQSKDGSYLEHLSGLTAFRADAAEKMAELDAADIDWDDE